MHLLSLVILSCAVICEGFKKCFIGHNSCTLVKAAVPDQSPFSGRHLFVLSCFCDLSSAQWANLRGWLVYRRKPNWGELVWPRSVRSPWSRVSSLQTQECYPGTSWHIRSYYFTDVRKKFSHHLTYLEYLAYFIYPSSSSPALQAEKWRNNQILTFHDIEGGSQLDV